MTDEPTSDDLEQRLRRDLGEIADAVPVDEPPLRGDERRADRFCRVSGTGVRCLPSPEWWERPQHC